MLFLRLDYMASRIEGLVRHQKRPSRQTSIKKSQ
jgi:hypothetical protein